MIRCFDKCISWFDYGKQIIGEIEQELSFTPPPLDPKRKHLFVQLYDKENFVAKFVLANSAEKYLDGDALNQHFTCTYLALGIYKMHPDAIDQIQKIVFSQLHSVRMPHELSNLIYQYYDPALGALTNILRSSIERVHSMDLDFYKWGDIGTILPKLIIGAFAFSEIVREKVVKDDFLQITESYIGIPHKQLNQEGFLSLIKEVKDNNN